MKSKVLRYIAFGVAIAVGVWLIVTVVGVVADQRDNAEDRKELVKALDDLKDKNKALQASIDEINKRCEKAENCIPIDISEVDDPELIPIPGPSGPPGKDGRNGRPGRNGTDGADGQNGTPGEDGSPGSDGQDGLPGEPGPSGPPGQDGVDGQNGADGQDGEDGRSITDAQCSAETGRWTISWSDGTTSDGGPCMVVHGPPPDEET